MATEWRLREKLMLAGLILTAIGLIITIWQVFFKQDTQIININNNLSQINDIFEDVREKNVTLVGSFFIPCKPDESGTITIDHGVLIDCKKKS